MSCQLEVSATGRLLIQRSPTDCSVSNLTHIIYNLVWSMNLNNEQV